MMPLVIDRDGRSTIAAAEGQAALASGDTLLARDKYGEAGELLQRSLADQRKQPEKNLIRFLAATQYFKGGHYQKALDLSQRIEEKFLPPGVRPLFPKFFRDVKARSAPGYETGVRQALVNRWRAKQPQQVLELLQEHPYVLQRREMAFIRAVSCEELREYRAAAIFYRDAFQFGPGDLGMYFAQAALPLYLPGQGKLEEASQYVEQQLELIPNPVTYLSASLLAFHRVVAAGDEEARKLYAEQGRYFELAWSALQEWPKEWQNHPQVRSHVTLCFEALALGLSRLGEERRSREVCNAAIDFNRTSPAPWVVRGIVTYPDESAVTDFRKAIELGDQSYYPCYYLAHEAIVRDDFRTALLWAQQALGKDPGARIKSQLLGWTAICQHHLRADVATIETLFQMALEVDSQNEEVRGNYELFRESLRSHPPQLPRAWTRNGPRLGAEQFVGDHASALYLAAKQERGVEKMVQVAA